MNNHQDPSGIDRSSVALNTICFLLPVISLVLCWKTLGLDDPTPRYAGGGWLICVIIGLGFLVAGSSRKVKSAAGAFLLGCLLGLIGVIAYVGYSMLSVWGWGDSLLSSALRLGALAVVVFLTCPLLQVQTGPPS